MLYFITEQIPNARIMIQREQGPTAALFLLPGHCCANFGSRANSMDTANNSLKIAFDTTIEDFRMKLKDEALYREILQTTTIQQVYNTLDGRASRGTSLDEPFLEGLRRSAGVMEEFTWGPTKLLLQWADVLKQSLDIIIETTAEISILLPDIRKVTRIFKFFKCPGL
ncbi:hypothetical protein BDV96DRAFT_635917 [Lophiotrema nucula]|uniref:Uncharacterized protein n=1 Tax=Lophiotrema nucula TaxID=690887 RepID=A0A6A5YU19_9PLEO|nr:hypothetical protein BDV96DRAFT_635917 [Lophiotrema nucula]